MDFRANYVSTSVAGDYYQAMFEAEQGADDPDSAYLLIQRQFEDPDDDRCYIETHDKKYCGHFLLRRVDFTPQKCDGRSDLSLLEWRRGRSGNQPHLRRRQRLLLPRQLYDQG